MFAYALQIYCDFSGYTDMALGTAHMLGYKLAKNFDLPYLAAERLGVLASLAHLALDLAARLLSTSRSAATATASAHAATAG